jgi:hypothetical protein
MVDGGDINPHLFFPDVEDRLENWRSTELLRL